MSLFLAKLQAISCALYFIAVGTMRNRPKPAAGEQVTGSLLISETWCMAYFVIGTERKFLGANCFLHYGIVIVLLFLFKHFQCLLMSSGSYHSLGNLNGCRPTIAVI